MASWRMQGLLLKSCNCPTLCACDTARTPPQAGCDSVLAMHVDAGYHDDTELGGLRWAMVLSWPRSLFDGDGTREIIVDAAADAPQRAALPRILGGEAGGVYFQILRAVITTTRGPFFAPIHFELDRERRRGRVAIVNRLEVTMRPLAVALTGEEQRVILRLPGGLAGREVEAARTARLAAVGSVPFLWEDTHAASGFVEFSSEDATAPLSPMASFGFPSSD